MSTISLPVIYQILIKHCQGFVLGHTRKKNSSAINVSSYQRGTLVFETISERIMLVICSAQFHHKSLQYSSSRFLVHAFCASLSICEHFSIQIISKMFPMDLSHCSFLLMVTFLVVSTCTNCSLTGKIPQEFKNLALLKTL